ncbi:MAG: hypothetical protein PF637_12895 [Spirochaetes bacterium]|jgi:hypothetical protein|nr:hypothetical protein [Spirochaetota bacterium]
MKKITTFSTFAVFFLLFTSILAAPKTGGVPDSIQGAFYDPSYKPIYLTGVSAKPDTWQTYKVAIKKSSVVYDGKGGSFKGFTMLRIKSNTEKPGVVLAVYFANVAVIDASGKKVMDFSFKDGENHGPYVSWGSQGSGTGKIETIKGKKAFTLFGTTGTQYGSTGLEVQWVMPKSPTGGSWDFSKPGYTLSFDYYISTK